MTQFRIFRFSNRDQFKEIDAKTTRLPLAALAENPRMQLREHGFLPLETIGYTTFFRSEDGLWAAFAVLVEQPQLTSLILLEDYRAYTSYAREFGCLGAVLEWFLPALQQKSSGLHA